MVFQSSLRASLEKRKAKKIDAQIIGRYVFQHNQNHTLIGDSFLPDSGLTHIDRQVGVLIKTATLTALTAERRAFYIHSFIN